MFTCDPVALLATFDERDSRACSAPTTWRGFLWWYSRGEYSNAVWLHVDVLPSEDPDGTTERRFYFMRSDLTSVALKTLLKAANDFFLTITEVLIPTF